MTEYEIKDQIINYLYDNKGDIFGYSELSKGVDIGSVELDGYLKQIAVDHTEWFSFTSDRENKVRLLPGAKAEMVSFINDGGTRVFEEKKAEEFRKNFREQEEAKKWKRLLQEAQLENFNETTRTARESRKTSWIAVVISVVALVIAILTFIYKK